MINPWAIIKGRIEHSFNNVQYSIILDSCISISLLRKFYVLISNILANGINLSGV